jgi:hypothetical protein
MNNIDLIAVLSAAFALFVLVRIAVTGAEIRRELRRLRCQRERLCADRERIAVAYEQAAHDVRLLLALTIRQQTAVQPPVLEYNQTSGRPHFRINKN